MKKYLFLLLALLTIAILQGCANYGTKKTFDGVDLYRTDKITAAEADKLGKYLVDQKFADGNEKSVQITKSGDVYQFRFVVKDGAAADPSTDKTTKFFGSMMSAQVFDGAPVEVQMCDDQFKTLKVIVADSYGKEKIFNGLSLFHAPSVTDAEVDSLGSYLVSSKFADGKPKSVMLSKAGNTYQFKFVIKSGLEKSSDFIKNVKAFAGELSKGAFHGAPTSVLLADDTFNVLVVVPMDEGATSK